MCWRDAAVVVTGATRGIGRAVVGTLVQRGARVGCVARSRSELDQLAAAYGGTARVAVAVADVGDPVQVRAAFESLGEALGPVDVLIANAGVGLYGPVAKLQITDAERLMRVNYLGVVAAVHAVLPSMISRRAGRIVLVGSVAARVAAPLEAAYSASKFAVTGFGEALAVEVAPFDVRVAMVHPGPVDTGFFEERGHPYLRRHPRPIAAGEVARAVLEAADRGPAEVFVPRLLTAAVVVRHLAPRFYGAAIRRSFAAEVALADQHAEPGS